MSQSGVISSERPKCTNLAQAGTNAYETVENRPVKDPVGIFEHPRKIILVPKYLTHPSADLINFILAVTLDVTMYTWNILEAANFSEGIVNQSNPGTGLILCHFMVMILAVLVLSNTVIAVSESEHFPSSESTVSYDVTINTSNF